MMSSKMLMIQIMIRMINKMCLFMFHRSYIRNAQTITVSNRDHGVMGHIVRRCYE